MRLITIKKTYQVKETIIVGPVEFYSRLNNAFIDAVKFDANGKLIDENTQQFLRQLLQNVVNWTRKLKR
jgi:hypothetical protein